ncbi:uncharacterized protein G2W53_039756 [Senna tora]|uniref:Uncharacterized protein n=1 Tax=Senna tora TaxID=362788 RepID=A0A834SN87_9FABA|nr:uncharacterized protein G2W53_039756 [Senna tora]
MDKIGERLQEGLGALIKVSQTKRIALYLEIRVDLMLEWGS